MNIDKKINEITNKFSSCNISILEKEILFYRQSLNIAEKNINSNLNKKSLKDLIGYEFEQHRKRIWEFFGFTLDKNKKQIKICNFKVDWCIYKNDKLIAYEEDKDHYVDSCFLDRTIISFAKTIQNYEKLNLKYPILILHSFTHYKLFQKKIDEIYDLLKSNIALIMNKNMKYTYLCDYDRLPRKNWFNKNKNIYPYSQISDKFIIKDIEFIKNLLTD